MLGAPNSYRVEDDGGGCLPETALWTSVIEQYALDIRDAIKQLKAGKELKDEARAALQDLLYNGQQLRYILSMASGAPGQVEADADAAMEKLIDYIFAQVRVGKRLESRKERIAYLRTLLPRPLGNITGVKNKGGRPKKP